MESLWKVWFSKRRHLYIEIARKHRSTPWRVYHLGHGGRGKTLKDMRILEELQQYGIISRNHLWFKQRL